MTTPASTNQTAWLIERGQLDRPALRGQTLWWCGDDSGVVGDWSPDANKALKFPTKEAAESVIRERSGVLARQLFGVATEHLWFPATPFDAAVITASREDRLVFVAFDRKGRPLPAGASVDRLGNLYDVDGLPLLHYEDVRHLTPGRVTELPEPEEVYLGMLYSINLYARGVFTSDEHRERVTLKVQTTLLGRPADGTKRTKSIEGEVARFVRDAQAPVDLEIDAARARHRSACEEKRRRAFTNGLITGLAIGVVVIVLLAGVAAYVYLLGSV